MGLSIWRLQIFVLGSFYAIAGVWIRARQTPRPLPHVPGHIQQPIGADASGVIAHWCRISFATFTGIAACGIPPISPGIEAAVRALPR